MQRRVICLSSQYTMSHVCACLFRWKVAGRLCAHQCEPTERSEETKGCVLAAYADLLMASTVHALAPSGKQMPEEYVVEEADDHSKAAYLVQALKEHGQNFSGEKEGVQDTDLQEAVCCMSTACLTFLLFVVCASGSGLDG